MLIKVSQAGVEWGKLETKGKYLAASSAATGKFLELLDRKQEDFVLFSVFSQFRVKPTRLLDMTNYLFVLIFVYCH